MSAERKRRMLDAAEAGMRPLIQKDANGVPPRFYLDLPEGLNVHFEFEYDGSDFAIAVLREIALQSGAAGALLAADVGFAENIQGSTPVHRSALALMGCLADGSAFSRLIPYSRKPRFAFDPPREEGVSAPIAGQAGRLRSWFRSADTSQWPAAARAELSRRVEAGLDLVTAARRLHAQSRGSGASVH